MRVITWSWWHNFFSSSRVQAYMYVKGCAICQAKGFHFAEKPPACGSRGLTWVLNRTFDIIQVIWRHWSFCGITHDFVNVVSFRSISVCLILVVPWKVKVLMWPTCLSWKMVLLTCRWDKINAFLFMSRFFLATWETVVFSLLQCILNHHKLEEIIDWKWINTVKFRK